MSTLYVTRPDSRVNLGAPPTLPRRTGDVEIAVKVTLTDVEAGAICGPGPIDPALCHRFVEDWLSPAIADLGDELTKRATGNRICRSCQCPLVGSEIPHGTCGACGDRSVRL